MRRLFLLTLLLRCGITQEQVLRIKSNYEVEKGESVNANNAPTQMRQCASSLGESYEVAELEDQKKVIDEKLNTQVQMVVSDACSVDLSQT